MNMDWILNENRRISTKRLRLTRLRPSLRSLRTWISKPDSSHRGPVKDFEELQAQDFLES